MNRGGGATDAVVVGAGPNGLSAAIALAREGRSVRVLEAAATVGGGSRSAELTLPGFLHDVCSAVHPLGRASPFWATLPLERHGLRWIEPPIQVAHPLDDDESGFLYRDLEATAEGLGQDAVAYRRLVGPVVRDWPLVIGELAGPFHVPWPPTKVLAAAAFALRAIRPASRLARTLRTPQARALLAGCAAHSFLRLTQPVSGAFGLVFLASTHAVGWPIAEGGSQRIADALGTHLAELGGEVVTDAPVGDLEELPPHRAVLLDLTPRQVVGLAGDRLARGGLGRAYVRQLHGYRYGPGVFKLDLALDGPIPWRDERILQAGTVHLGGTFEEIARSEAAVRRGVIPERPFVLLSQPSLFDPSRAPVGQHTVWAYCHVPNGARADMTDAILGQIERFAPGVRQRILALATTAPEALERYNANYVGGDISGGLPDLRQLLTRPAIRLDPYTTPDRGIFICSASTPPGAGVHGLCGWYAARSALRSVLAD